MRKDTTSIVIIRKTIAVENLTDCSVKVTLTKKSPENQLKNQNEKMHVFTLYNIFKIHFGLLECRRKSGLEGWENISESSKTSWFPIIERLLAPLISKQRYVEIGVL
jgi:hypothetical protein